MSIRPPSLPPLRELPNRLLRSLDPAVRWLRRELDTARRDDLDAQFMATSRGGLYRHPDHTGR
jgi:hypothetical protein